MRSAHADDGDDGVDGCGAPLRPPAIVEVRRRTIAGWGWEEEEEKARADGAIRSRMSGRSSDDGGGGSARLTTLGWDVGGDDVDDDDDDAALLMVSGSIFGVFGIFSAKIRSRPDYTTILGSRTTWDNS